MAYFLGYGGVGVGSRKLERPWRERGETGRKGQGWVGEDGGLAVIVVVVCGGGGDGRQWRN